MLKFNEHFKLSVGIFPLPSGHGALAAVLPILQFCPSTAPLSMQFWDFTGLLRDIMNKSNILTTSWKPESEGSADPLFHMFRKREQRRLLCVVAIASNVRENWRNLCCAFFVFCERRIHDRMARHLCGIHYVFRPSAIFWVYNAIRSTNL